MAPAPSSTPDRPLPSTKSKPRKSKPNPSHPPPLPQSKAELPLVRYPPFPTVPPDVEIIPYSQFKEFGIRLHGLPSSNEKNGTSDTEVDGLGIPTVTLRVRHDTDKCKTFTRGREQTENMNQKKAKSSLKEPVADPAPVMKKDPVARALELKQQRLLLFSKMEWYEQWAEGEAMRGTSVYDSDLTIIDRVHFAANDFRKGRVWPLSSSGLKYLWDQFRLYVGLLGQPPVWYRADLHQNPDDVVDDIEGNDEVSFEKIAAGGGGADSGQSKEKSILDDDFFDEDSEVDEPVQKQSTSNMEDNQEKAPQRKRVPPRTPYALHNVVPIALSSQSQVKSLLSIAYFRKYQKLESFIYTPDTCLRIFFSWYLHHQGFIFSPHYLANLPRLVLFFLEFLVRTKAVYESERSLKAAVEVAKKAVREVPAAGRMCRILPDKMGVGCMLHWGRRWVDEDQPFVFRAQRDRDAEEAKQEALKRFEEELKNENVQVVSAEATSPVEGLEDNEEAGITIQVLSPTSGEFPNLEERSTAFIEEVNEDRPPTEKTDDRWTTEKRKVEEEIISAVQESSTSQPTTIHSPTLESSTESAASSSKTNEQTLPIPESEMDQSIPSHWDADPTLSQDKPKLDAWTPKVGQPLVEMFGMTILPIKYNPGVAERSMRRVKEVIPAGGKSKEAAMERKWRGLQGVLVGKLARVVLEPWLDWDDGGIAAPYRKPRIQALHEEKQKYAQGEEYPPDAEGQKPGVEEHSHDPMKDVITILVEPRVAEQVSIGMGLAGTWIQMVKVQDYWKHAGLSVPDKRGEQGHSRGRGRGRGRARGRGGATNGSHNDPINPASPDPAIRVETADRDVNNSLPEKLTGSKDEVAEPERGSSCPGNETTMVQGVQRGGRGRGSGRGGYYRHHQTGAEKEFVFWYVEDIFMAIPSFWMAGKEEEPIKMTEGEEDDDLLSDLED